MINAAAILKSFTQPATLGHKAQEFMETLDAKLPERPTKLEFERALNDTLKLRRFRNLNPGLRALAEAAWVEKGESGIKCHLKQQADIAFDVESRDRWNRDVRANLGPILQTIVRRGKSELTTADTVAAFALEHGLPLLEETIKDRYHPPAIEDREAWRKSVIEALKADLAKNPAWEVKIELEKVDALAQSLTGSFDAWLSMTPEAQKTVWGKIETLIADLKDQPTEVLIGSFKEAAYRLNRMPAEVNVLGTIALSVVLAAKLGFAVATVPAAISVTLALLGGWLAADFVGSIFHWNKDNYPKGRIGREFIDHHYNPTAVSKWPLRRNADGMSMPVMIGLAATATFVPGGALAAFLLSMLNGVLYTQHIHGYSHAHHEDVPKAIKLLQNVPVLPPLLSPREHTKHHGRPLGKEAYGVLNGWSNYITDATQFFRILEVAREALTGEKPTWEHEKEVRAIAMDRKKRGIRTTHDC